MALESDLALDLKEALERKEALWAALGDALQLPGLQKLELQAGSEEQLAKSLQAISQALAL